MKNIEKLNSTIVNVLFSMFPLFLIFGNLFTNLNIILLCVFSFIFYSKEIKKFKINLLDKIIIIFFIYTLITLIINFLGSYYNYDFFSKTVIFKTLLYLRYLVLYFVLRVLVSKKILRLDYFFLTCALCAAFICLDIFVQFIFGKNIFGMEPVSVRHYSGVFGDELIAGGYLQKFALFSFFLPFVIKKKNYKAIIQFIFFIIFMFGIVLSGNRMSFLLFVLSYAVFIIFSSDLKKYFLTFSIIFFIIISLHYNLNQNFKIRMDGFTWYGKILINSLFEKNLDTAEGRLKEKDLFQKPYVAELFCARTGFKRNPIFGGGVRSYRTINFGSFYNGCATHPHNYYAEILSDLGLVGLSIILVFIFILFRKIFKNSPTTFHLNFNKVDIEIVPFFLIIFIEFFPLRTSGSFFSTNNASIIFLILAVLVSLVSKKKLDNI